jgi:hypothetical protein
MSVPKLRFPDKEGSRGGAEDAEKILNHEMHKITRKNTRDSFYTRFELLVFFVVKRILNHRRHLSADRQTELHGRGT